MRILSSEALWRGTTPAYHSPSADDPRKKSLPRKGKDAFAWYHLAFILCQGAYRKSKSPCPLWDRGEIAVPPCIILSWFIRNGDFRLLYGITASIRSSWESSSYASCRFSPTIGSLKRTSYHLIPVIAWGIELHSSYTAKRRLSNAFSLYAVLE